MAPPPAFAVVTGPGSRGITSGNGSGPGRARKYPCPHATPMSASVRSSPIVSTPFGHDGHAQLAPELDEGASQGLAGEVLVHALGDAHVELDDVGQQPQHVAEAGVARAPASSMAKRTPRARRSAVAAVSVS